MLNSILALDFPGGARGWLCGVAIELVQSYLAKIYAEATNSKKVDLVCIILTSNALIEHIKRVYFQVQAWYGSQGQDETLDPLEWGRELVDGELTPVTMTQEAGHEEILSKISCSCETDCGTTCGCAEVGWSAHLHVSIAMAIAQTKKALPTGPRIVTRKKMKKGKKKSLNKMFSI
ncbi:unnamed protein product [Psylliodes chrysocephalus]|uniref:Uncharacterized protein n=1 Tax=Psylliodes chrysocephalus TaxID=3402493 RepID=A0A9P0CRU4_9CUCU|nr:unnamed protein product [Psylliodes chrysocephala]